MGRLEDLLQNRDPRASTTDAAAERADLMAMHGAIQRLAGIPGLIDKTPQGAGDDAVYAQGLQKFEDGDKAGALNLWATIPHHPEARTAMEHIYKQEQGR